MSSKTEAIKKAFKEIAGEKIKKKSLKTATKELQESLASDMFKNKSNVFNSKILVQGEGIFKDWATGGPEAYQQWLRKVEDIPNKAESIKDILRSVYYSKKGAIITLEQQGLDPKDFLIEDVSSIIGSKGWKIRLK